MQNQDTLLIITSHLYLREVLALRATCKTMYAILATRESNAHGIRQINEKMAIEDMHPMVYMDDVGLNFPNYLSNTIPIDEIHNLMQNFKNAQFSRLELLCKYERIRHEFYDLIMSKCHTNDNLSNVFLTREQISRVKLLPADLRSSSATFLCLGYSCSTSKYCFENRQLLYRSNSPAYSQQYFRVENREICDFGSEIELWESNIVTHNLMHTKLRTCYYAIYKDRSVPTIAFLFFKKSNRMSFSNVKIHWIPELRYNVPKAHLILIGIKGAHRKTELVSNDEAIAVAKKLGCATYVEMSNEPSLKELDKLLKSMWKTQFLILYHFLLFHSCL